MRKIEPKKPLILKKSLSPEEQAQKDKELAAKKLVDDKRKRIKGMLKIFTQLYPQYMDGNSIKYPIEDNLIVKMRELHGSEHVPPKPEPHRVHIPW